MVDVKEDIQRVDRIKTLSQCAKKIKTIQLNPSLIQTFLFIAIENAVKRKDIRYEFKYLKERADLYLLVFMPFWRLIK